MQYQAEELDDVQKAHEDTKAEIADLKTTIEDQGKKMKSLQAGNNDHLHEVYEMKWVKWDLSLQIEVTEQGLEISHWFLFPAIIAVSLETVVVKICFPI